MNPNSMNLIFSLGKNPLLSIAEIFSVFESRNIKYSVILADENFLYLNIEKAVYPDILIKILGGTISIFRVDDIVPRQDARKIKRQFKINLYEDKTVLGETVAKQDINDFKRKEMEKPYINPKEGMLPAKLSKILVNLSITKETNTIYDPFCGSGSICIEAISQGYNVFASDISQIATEGTLGNLKWAKRTFSPDIDLKIEVFKHDAKGQPDRLMNKGLHIAIATEPYMGENWKKPIPKNVRNIKTIAKVDAIIQSSIKSMSRVLKEKERFVITIPTFRTKHDIIKLEAREKHFPGLLKISLLPKDLIFDGKKVDTIQSYLYNRDRSIVSREIFIFEKQ